MLTFDHDLLARRDPREVKRYRDYLLSIVPGPPTPVFVVHDDDGACCRREPWDETDRRIVLAVAPAGGLTLLNIDLTGDLVLGRCDG